VLLVMRLRTLNARERASLPSVVQVLNQNRSVRGGCVQKREDRHDSTPQSGIILASECGLDEERRAG
jgi:hypothetical protein